MQNTLNTPHTRLSGPTRPHKYNRRWTLNDARSHVSATGDVDKTWEKRNF